MLKEGGGSLYAIAKKYYQRTNETIIESKDFSPEDTWYRVTMGDFDAKEEALKTVTLLKEASPICIPEPPMKRGR